MRPALVPASCRNTPSRRVGRENVMRKRWSIFVVALASIVLSTQSAFASTGFTTQVSPSAQTNATEPSVAVDRSDGTVWVAWQAGGRHVARSDDGGRTFVETPIVGLFTNDIGDVDIRVGGPTPCRVPSAELSGINCLPGSHRVYVTSIEETPLPLQVHLFYSDDRGASWTGNQVAVVNPSLVDRPWLAVFPGSSAVQDKVYIGYHDFSVSQIWVTASTDGGDLFGPSVDVIQDPTIEANSACNTVPSDMEVDPNTGEVYIQWITADPVQNLQGCNITQDQQFHKVYVAHSTGAVGMGTSAAAMLWDDHPIFDGGPGTNTDEIFAALAVDQSGNVYSVFPDNLDGPRFFDIWFTHSSDKARSWSPPVMVDDSGGTNYFPWIAAGSTGRVDFIYLHSPDLNPSDTALSPWYSKFAQTIDGTDPTPKFAVTSTSSGIMHVGGICTSGIFCTATSGNRDLADSISIAIDRGGSAALAWTNQGTVLHGPTDIIYGCLTAQQSAMVGANQGLSCKGPAGP
jgi:hypothetical protein